MSKIGLLGDVLNGESIPREKGIYPAYGGNGIITYVNKYNYDENTIIIGRVGANCGAVHFSQTKCWVTDNALVFRTNEKNDAYFVYCLLRTLSLNRFHIGSSQPLITQSIVKQIEYDYVTELKKQEQISSVIRCLDEKILNNIRILKELEASSQDVYLYWLVQFDFPDNYGHPYKSSGGKMEWNEKLKRNIPVGWEVKSIGELLEDKRGISYSSETIEGDGVPMINLASFTPDGQYNDDGLKVFSGEYAEDKILKPYDLVICNTQQTAIDFDKDIIGKALLVPDIFDGDIVSSHHVTALKVYDDNMKYYLFRLFNTDYFHKFLTGYTNGTNILGLLFDSVKQCEIEIPDKKTLRKFAKIIHTIESKKSNIIKENQELAKLRDFLLPMLMSGQVHF